MDLFIGKYYILLPTHTIDKSKFRETNWDKSRDCYTRWFLSHFLYLFSYLIVSVFCVYLFVVNLKVGEVSTVKVVLTLIILTFFLLVSSLVEEGGKQNKNFSPSKQSCRESASLTFSSPPVNQESLTVKEKFIPPELSIWDYFIAKVIKVLSRSIFM